MPFNRAVAFMGVVLCGLAGSPAFSAPMGQVLFSPAQREVATVPDSAIVIGRAATPPVLDGVIGPEEWAAAGTGSFAFNGDASKMTAVYALYDTQNLYLAFRCQEPFPARMRAASGPGKAAEFGPDASGDCRRAYEDDSIEVFIAPDARQKVVYQFIGNSIGAQLDIRYELPKSDASWTSGFKSAARVEGAAWTIEFRIPLKAIGIERVTPGQTALRVNFGRNRMVEGDEHAPWQSFWAWQGAMPQALFAPTAPVALGAIRFGQRYVGENEASVEARAVGPAPARVRLVAKTTQGGAVAARTGPEETVKPGEPLRLTVPYVVPRADSPFDLALVIEGAGAWTMEEKGLAPEPPIVAMIERNCYGGVDGPAVFFFNLHLRPASLKDFRLRAALLAEGRPMATVETPLQTTTGEVRFVLDQKEPAEFSAALSLLDAKGEEVYTRTTAPVTWAGIGEKAKPATGRIPLKLDVAPTNSAPSGRWPVTVGVPFRRGALTNEANVRLLSPAGEELPAEISVPAAWDRARSSVRWLHLKCLVALEDAGKVYTLEYGPDIQRAAEPSKLKASQSNDSIVIDTGRLRLQISRRPFRFIDAAWLDRNGDGRYADDERVIVPGSASGLLVETTDGRRFRSDAARDWPEMEKVELESVGPVEAVVRAEGWHKALPSSTIPPRMMKYVVRIIATADTGLLRVFHSFILTENEEVQYRQVTLGFGMADEETSVADHQSRLPAKLTPGAEVALVQADHDAYRLQLRTPERAPSLVALQSGDHSEGWLLIQRNGWGLTLATRDFWQNYCKGYEVRRDAVTLCPWPKEAPVPLSFRPEDVVAPIFAKRLCYLSNGVRIEDGGNYTTYTYGVGSTPLGVSKTHEYLLDFTPAPSTARSRMVQQLLNDPPLLIVPPDYACGTDVFGRLAPYNAQTYPMEEKAFKAMLARVEYGRPEFRHYGLVNFGESYQQTDDTGGISVYRTWQNAGYGIVNDFYRGYLRSGDRDWFRYAVRRVRHHRDLDHCHYGPKAGGETEYDTLHWGPVFEALTFWNHRLCLLQDWYMTGDRRSWDTFLLAGEAILRYHFGPGPRDERSYFNPPKELILAYEATWDPRFLDMARTLVDGILLAKEQAGAGQWPAASLQMSEYLQPSLLAYHRFTGDPRVLEYLKAHFLHQKGRQNYANNQGQDLAAHLYWVTGDVSWLELVGGYEAMRDYMRLWETGASPPVGGLRRKNVSEALSWMQTWRLKQKVVFHDGFIDKGFHHTWERFWYFMPALDDARAKGALKPYQGPNNPWAEPVWDADYWKSVPPEKAKEWGWQ